MQLDVIQKSIIGVLGFTGLLALIAPTNLAPKPPAEAAQAVAVAPAPAPEVAPAPPPETDEEYVIDEEDQDISSYSDPDVILPSPQNTDNNANSPYGSQPQVGQQPAAAADAAANAAGVPAQY